MESMQRLTPNANPLPLPLPTHPVYLFISRPHAKLLVAQRALVRRNSIVKVFQRLFPLCGLTWPTRGHVS
jgi:hypothetical protein